jgi:hypothetical protein
MRGRWRSSAAGRRSARRHRSRRSRDRLQVPARGSVLAGRLAGAPTHAAVNGFIAAHAAAFAAAAVADVAAVPREPAAQARWLAQRLALESG